MEHLDDDSFKSRVFDYEKEDEWSFSGERPAIVDFYADWCGPCRSLSPILEELSTEYAGRLDIFKVDTERARAVSGAFGISSIPALLFIPKDGKPRMALGALPKSALKQAIADILGVAE